MAVVAWFYVLIGIFIVMVIYFIGSYFLYGQNGLLSIALPAIGNLTPSNLNTTQRDNVLNTIHMVWNVWPFVFIIALVIYGFLNSMKKEPFEYVR